MRLSTAVALASAAAWLSACRAGDCDREVEPSADAQDSVQAAFSAAAPGDVVCLGKGRFSGFESELTISADDVEIRGAGREATILDFAGQQAANGIEITGNGVTITDLYVTDTPGDGIRAQQVDDVTFRTVRVDWSAEDGLSHGAYGLYPVGCDGVTIEGCVVYGARDAGIYVGQSRDIVVEANEAAWNVAGIEIENSHEAEVFDNYAHHNVGGLLIFDLPGLADPSGEHTKAHHNVLERNNTASFAEPGTAVAAVPRGTGLVMLAASAADVHDNEIRENDGAGLILLHCHTALFGDGCNDPAYDPMPRGNWIHDNTFTGNGTDPPTFIIDMLGGDQGQIDLPVPAMFWDGGYPGCPGESLDGVPAADLNCFSDNVLADGDPATFVNFNLCDDFQNQSTELGEMACEHEGLPSLDP
jgi:parallel beta-helix repeat protein